jgi:hypothetical protein
MKSLARTLILCALVAMPAWALDTFNSEADAQRHCPRDVVVWLNMPTMIWHFKGQRWYANTLHGAFACEKEAAANGARATRNGQ